MREYGIDLGASLSVLSWRRFLALLRGLSPLAATVTAMRSRIEFGERTQPVSVEGDAAQRAFEALFGGAPVPGSSG